MKQQSADLTDELHAAQDELNKDVDDLRNQTQQNLEAEVQKINTQFGEHKARDDQIQEQL